MYFSVEYLVCVNLHPFASEYFTGGNMLVPHEKKSSWQQVVADEKSVFWLIQNTESVFLMIL